MVVFDKGDLSIAMRASMAVPGAFAPVDYDGRGARRRPMLVRNLPVDVARATCADVVIAVNLVEPPAQREKLQSATQLLSRSMDVMLQANETLQLQTLTDRDVRIDVFMGDIGTADFERVPETIPLGVAAARAASRELSAFALPEAEYLAWRRQVTESQDIEARLADVRYEGLERVNPDFLAQKSQVSAGDVVDTANISEEAQRMSALKDFDSIEYRLEGDPSSPTLVWMPAKSASAPTT